MSLSKKLRIRTSRLCKKRIRILRLKWRSLRMLIGNMTSQEKTDKRKLKRCPSRSWTIKSRWKSLKKIMRKNTQSSRSDTKTIKRSTKRRSKRFSISSLKSIMTELESFLSMRCKNLRWLLRSTSWKAAFRKPRRNSKSWETRKKSCAYKQEKRGVRKSSNFAANKERPGKFQFQPNTTYGAKASYRAKSKLSSTESVSSGGEKENYGAMKPEVHKFISDKMEKEMVGGGGDNLNITPL